MRTWGHMLGQGYTELSWGLCGWVQDLDFALPQPLLKCSASSFDPGTLSLCGSEDMGGFLPSDFWLSLQLKEVIASFFVLFVCLFYFFYYQEDEPLVFPAFAKLCCFLEGDSVLSQLMEKTGNLCALAVVSLIHRKGEFHLCFFRPRSHSLPFSIHTHTHIHIFSFFLWLNPCLLFKIQ